ncbi:flagellar basal body-associated protein FliL [Methylobacillus gramineus]|uniref:flagellar basal body-associated protein FliL n=1 Tax=Methylobacillus gramineus TaxID=755169 RepID=UPI001CFF8900|nr:flagellar basal body-associated protein FliL [Methylobacillus gramineus]MCB5183768.1 flagellar basal body-associated protein FliL [Methylobacillus gramineus]
MAQQEAAAEEVKPKKSKKIIILAVVGVLLLSAIGGGAAWYFGQHSGGHDAKPKEEKKVAQDPVFLTLETFTVNLQPDPDEQYLQTDISVQVEDAAQADLIKLHMPSVRSRILILLSSKKSSEVLSVEGKKALTKEIIAQLAEPFVAGEKPQAVKAVFFTSFVIQ